MNFPGVPLRLSPGFPLGITAEILFGIFLVISFEILAEILKIPSGNYPGIHARNSQVFSTGKCLEIAAEFYFSEIRPGISSGIITEISS